VQSGVFWFPKVKFLTKKSLKSAKTAKIACKIAKKVQKAPKNVKKAPFSEKLDHS
jgi:hypothetical protein